MSDTITSRAYTKVDIIVIGFAVLFASVVVAWWMPARQDDTQAMVAYRLMSGFLTLVSVFVAMSAYGIVRFVSKGRRLLVSGLVALPALYGGLIIGGLRQPDQEPYPSPSQNVRVQDGLAALWWGKSAATDLPAWSRGGSEIWPTINGDMLVKTGSDQVDVVLASKASNRECQRLVSDLSVQQPALSNIGGWMSVNGKRVSSNDSLLKVCNDGAMVSLSASLPSEN